MENTSDSFMPRPLLFCLKSGRSVCYSVPDNNLFQSKVKESGRTQQEVVIKAIADLKIATAEEIEELRRLNQMFADILCQLRGATTNINQIARKLHTDGEIPNDSMLYFLNKNILKYRKESERIWQLIRRLISGQIHMEQ